MHWAAYNGHQAVVQTLIAAGAHVNQQIMMAILLCMVLLINGHQAVVQALIAAGANVNQQNHDGSTPLHRAAY